MGYIGLFVWLRFYDPVNRYGHVETGGSPNHTFSLASLTKGLTSEYFMHILSLVTDTPILNQRKEEL